MDTDDRLNANDAFWNRIIHHELNEEILAGIPDDALEQAIIDYLVLRVGADWAREYEVIKGLSPGFRAVYATWSLEGEVDNGGFSQFFSNPSGPFAYEALEAYRLIGAPEHTRLVEEAIALEKAKGTPLSQFPETGAPKDGSETHDYADFSDLDQRHYDSREDTSQLRIRYIRAHPEQFVGERVD